jgi:hypothetical protein
LPRRCRAGRCGRGAGGRHEQREADADQDDAADDPHHAERHLRWFPWRFWRVPRRLRWFGGFHDGSFAGG